MTGTERVFFALLRSGLWEQEIELLPYGPVDFDAIYKLAEEQSVIGLVGAALEHITDGKPGKMQIRPFLTWVIAQEQQNSAMNEFVGWLFGRLKEEGIQAVLLKGQGVAQCYSRPNWRACGDIDLFLDEGNYEKAKRVLTPLASHVEPENVFKKDLDMTIGPWTVELHGTMNTQLSKRVNEGVAAVRQEIFTGGVRPWMNEGVEVPLPSADNDVIIIFTHFLNHFFIGGVGLRQICDWCRLLWTYRDEIEPRALDLRLREMGLMSEWRAFAAFAVEWLGMPVEAMPLYSPSASRSRKAKRICRIVMEAGNFGHNKDNTYRSRFSGLKMNLITLFRRIGDFAKLATIFPLDAPRFFAYYLSRRAEAVL